jgi:hypothetical protein
MAGVACASMTMTPSSPMMMPLLGSPSRQRISGTQGDQDK